MLHSGAAFVLLSRYLTSSPPAGVLYREMSVATVICIFLGNITWLLRDLSMCFRLGQP